MWWSSSAVSPSITRRSRVLSVSSASRRASPAWRLAADLGFGDHAHLTRTIREQLGHTPAQLSRLLRAG
jgi:AraC-like DNA-binding protein